MAGHGGRRIGSGRPAKPKLPSAVDSEQFFDEQCRNSLHELWPVMKQTALGIRVGVYSEKPLKDHPEAEAARDEHGRRLFVYTTPPDKAMLQYLADRALGKAATKEKQQQDTEIILQCDVPWAPLDGAALAEAADECDLGRGPDLTPDAGEGPDDRTD